MLLDARRDQLVRRTFLDYRQMSEFLEQPLIINKAKGLYYWDKDGKRYFDGIGGIFVAVLGHGHPRVIEAMHKQMELISFAPPLHAISDVGLDLVERLGELTPGNLNYVKPFSGGSESVEAALKFARQYFKQAGYPNKFKFVSRYFGYHGGTFGAMAASGTGKRKTPFEPHVPGFVKVFPPTYYRDRFSSWEECNRFSARMFEDVIVMEDPDTVAGIIVEPIGNTGGIITPTEEYFQILREICDKYNVLLIFDEIITGYARTGNMFAAQTFGVTPDIICGGKGLSSGVIPLGAMMAREDMGELFIGPAEQEVSFAHGHTFAGNPLACAVGLAVLDELVEQNYEAKARDMGDYLATKLEGLKQYGVIREVRGKGILRGVELVRDSEKLQPFPELGRALKRTTLNNGLIMRVDPNWFAVAPALIAERSDIDELVDLIERSLLDALEQVGA
jgi:adenosylmethionine-8-amino-7-oxononanoate aminotransferase